MKLPALYYKNKKGKVFIYQICATEDGYDVYDGPNIGGKVREFHYKVHPPTPDNAKECALFEWSRKVEKDGYVKVIGDWGKKSYYERRYK